MLIQLPKSHCSHKLINTIRVQDGRTEDMDWCFNQARENIAPGKTIVISGGCESSRDVCLYADMNIPAFTVDHIGRGPQNDYLVLQMQSLLQDHTYAETLNILKERAPQVMTAYLYPN